MGARKTNTAEAEQSMGARERAPGMQRRPGYAASALVRLRRRRAASLSFLRRLTLGFM